MTSGAKRPDPKRTCRPSASTALYQEILNLNRQFAHTNTCCVMDCFKADMGTDGLLRPLLTQS